MFKLLKSHQSSSYTVKWNVFSSLTLTQKLPQWPGRPGLDLELSGSTEPCVWLRRRGESGPQPKAHPSSSRACALLPLKGRCHACVDPAPAYSSSTCGFLQKAVTWLLLGPLKSVAQPWEDEPRAEALGADSWSFGMAIPQSQAPQRALGGRGVGAFSLARGFSTLWEETPPEVGPRAEALQSEPKEVAVATSLLWNVEHINLSVPYSPHFF